MYIKKFKKLIVDSSAMLDKHPELRTGQALSNQLYEVYHSSNKLMSDINNQLLDPFYDNSKIESFLEFFVLKFKGKKRIEANFLSMGFQIKHMSKFIK